MTRFAELYRISTNCKFWRASSSSTSARFLNLVLFVVSTWWKILDMSSRRTSTSLLKLRCRSGLHQTSYPRSSTPRNLMECSLLLVRYSNFWLGRRLRLISLRMQAMSSEDSTYVSVMSLVGVSGLFCPGTKKITRLTRGCCSMRITALHPHNRSRTRISLREVRREPSCHRSYLFSLHPISVAHLHKSAWEQHRNDALRNTSM